MAWAELGSERYRAELSRARVGVIQHEPESLLTPGHDVLPFLRSRPDHWSVEAFSERDFGALLGAADRFDVIVVGFNALLNCDELRAALHDHVPATPMLVLHQRESNCWSFLREDLALSVSPLGSRVDRASVPRERDADDEPLLRWPHRALDRELRGEAVRSFAFSPDGAWRVVLEVTRGAQRVPVLVRTRSNHASRVVACSVLLRPAQDTEHGHLLENLLTYCASGWPDLAIADVPGADSSYDPDALARGMGMWSERCLRVSFDVPKDIPMDRWPLRGVRRLLVPESLEPGAVRDSRGGDKWFNRGGILVQMGASGRLTYHVGSRDRLIVLRRWAVWFGAAAPKVWLGRLSTARAVLRLLAQIEPYDRQILSEDLKVKTSPHEYAGPVAQLIASRVRHGNVDRTISATASVLDLDRLTGGQALTPWSKHRVRTWLESQLPQAGPEDQLEILRSLAGQEGLHEQLRHHHPADVSAVYATRLREAVRACWPAGDEPADLVPEPILDELANPRLEEELEQWPLLSAEFLAALYAPAMSPSDGDGGRLFDLERFASAEAVALSRLQAPDPAAPASEARLVCARTLAMLWHLRRNPLGALRALPDAAELPAGTVESVLEEATRARAGEREARHDLPALGTAAFLLGTGTLAMAAVALLALWDAWDVRQDPWWPALPLALAATLAILGAFRWGLMPRLEARADRRDLRFSQTIVGVFALAIALAAGTKGWALGGDSLAGKLAMGPLLFSTAFAALALVLSRFRVSPGWAQELLSITTDIKSPLTAIRERFSRRTSDGP